MKKVSLILSVLFIILTFTGTGYVLLNHGQVSAGYAAVPMALALACSGVYRTYMSKENK